jgi:RHH-type rel operon transcriptional repressor/antitoxin RelB
MLALRLPEDVEERLAALAKATGRSKSYYAREAIVQHLEDLEDIYLTEQRLIDHRKGSGETVSMDEMRRHLELDD